MPVKIIHISDVHFGGGSQTYDFNKVKEALAKNIKEIQGVKILALTGDIVFQGDAGAYDKAGSFFEELIQECDISRKHVLACPGNHDICNKSFEGFDRFVNVLRRDNEIKFSQRNSIELKIEDISFLLINSAYHLDHKFGYIPSETFQLLEDNKSAFSESKKRVVLTHHHFIGQDKLDTSTIRNAYKLIYHADGHEFDYLLHGHRHSKMDLKVGKNKVRVLSARSANYHDKGYANGFNIIDVFNDKVEQFIFSPDEEPGIIKAVTIQ